MILPSKEEFNFKDVVISGDECWLITPNSITCKWSEDNLKFRSVIVRKSDHKILSRGYNKYFNFSEQPDLDKFPTNGSFDVVEKLDGSLIIWSSHNEELIHRTRGTQNAESLPNGHEIQFLIQKYPKLIEFVKRFSQSSVLTEWQTNSNIIVVGGFPEPTLSLIGIIDNETGILMSQNDLDDIALKLDINRPKRYHYNSIEECINDVEMWIGKEGVVIYSEDGQKLRKVKSEWYRSLHALATGIRSISNVLDVFMESPKFVEYQKFYEYVEKSLDYEIAEKIKDEMKQITEAYGKFVHTLNLIQEGVNSHIRSYDTRKEQAIAIQREYSGWMIPVAFHLLDNKPIDDKVIYKSMEKILKK
jgi:hypothetical protein